MKYERAERLKVLNVAFSAWNYAALQSAIQGASTVCNVKLGSTGRVNAHQMPQVRVLHGRREECLGH